MPLRTPAHKPDAIYPAIILYLLLRLCADTQNLSSFGPQLLQWLCNFNLSVIFHFHILSSLSIYLYTPIAYDYTCFIYSRKLFFLLRLCLHVTTEMIQLDVQFLILYSGLQSIKQVIF